jgi:MtN3 and saliva related transmembrane protein
MEFIEGLGLVAGICTSSSIVPQLVKSIKTKQVKDVSVVMFIVLFTGNGLWIYYGLSKSDVPIVLTNSLSVILNIAMLVLKYKYRHNGE